MLIIPFVFLLQDHHHKGSGGLVFGVPFSGLYLGLVPLLGLQMLQYSQQWQASDIFRAAPLPGPGQICQGARCAVLCLLGLPVLLLVGLIVWLLQGDASQLILLLPGVIALPVFALIPSIGGHGVPLSLPTNAAKDAGQGLTMMGVMIVTLGLAALTSVLWTQGWFWWLVSGEAVVVSGLYFAMRLSLARVCWPSSE